jgi:solute carrier family 25 (mitochondrial phosphate transporter), member 23/24/25/41
MLFEVYRAVVTNRDGEITPDDLARQLQQSEVFSDHGIARKASQSLISRMDLIGNGSISFREFARVFVLLPDCDVELIFKHWAKYSHIDMGEDYSLPDEPSVEKSRTNIFLSGAIAGCISRCVTAPIDRLKVIMQAGKGDATIVNMMRYMYQEGGLRGMWRGNGINCVKIAPESASKFLCYGEFKRVVTTLTGGDEHAPTVIEKFMAGASAGAVSQALVYPLEITKTRLALSRTGLITRLLHSSPSPLSQGNTTASSMSSAPLCDREVRRGSPHSPNSSEGLAGLYRGLTASMLGIIPYAGKPSSSPLPPSVLITSFLVAGIDLMVFNTLKEKWVAKNNTRGENKTPGVMILVRDPPSTTALLTSPAALWSHLHDVWPGGGVPITARAHQAPGRQDD